MKNILLYLILLLNLVACKKETVFKLEGHSEQCIHNSVVGLRYPTDPGRQYFLSTEADSSNCFNLSGTIIPGRVAFLTFGYQQLPLYLENQHYRVIRENGNFYVVSDQKESLQNKYVEYLRQVYTLDSVYNQLCHGYDTISDINRKAVISANLKPEFDKRNDRIIQGIREFSGTEISLNIVNESMYLCEVDYRFFTRAIEALGTSIPEGKLKDRVMEAYKQATNKRLRGKAPFFSLPDAGGRMYTLNDFKGKYLLLDFWASWCAPCRAKNKELNKHFQELKNMGLEIVSVSFDNEREKWLKALQEDGVAWLQLVDLSGFKDSKTKIDYKVEKVPTVYLIDPQGEVLMTDPTLEDITKILK